MRFGYWALLSIGSQVVSCYRSGPGSVAEGYNGVRLNRPWDYPIARTALLPDRGRLREKAPVLLSQPIVGISALCGFRRDARQGDHRMSRAQWFLFGAVVIGLAVFVYLTFFCPTDCH